MAAQRKTSRFSKFNAVRAETGFRSGLEALVANKLKACGCGFGYETCKLKYVKPASNHTYTPDFILPDPCIVVEVKGRFLSEDRVKMKLVREQFPDLDIRFVFSNPQALITKGRPTTYADWCDKYGFPYAKQLVPESWLTHNPSSAQKEAFRAVVKK